MLSKFSAANNSSDVGVIIEQHSVRTPWNRNIRLPFTATLTLVITLSTHTAPQFELNYAFYYHRSTSKFKHYWCLTWRCGRITANDTAWVSKIHYMLIQSILLQFRELTSSCRRALFSIFSVVTLTSSQGTHNEALLWVYILRLKLDWLGQWKIPKQKQLPNSLNGSSTGFSNDVKHVP